MMTRLNTNAEIFAEVTEAGGLRDVSAGSSTTLSAAVAKGDKVLNVNDDLAGSLADGDLVRVGSDEAGEVHEIDTLDATSITLKSALIRAHDSGEDVVEQEKVNFGAVSEDGVNVDHEGTQTEIQAATQADSYAVILQDVSATMSWAMLNWSMENIAAALGIDESEITGSGTAADPTQLGIDGDVVDKVQDYGLYMRGALKNGRTFEIMAFNAAFDPNQAKNLLRGQAVTLPMSANVNTVVVRQWS